MNIEAVFAGEERDSGARSLNKKRKTGLQLHNKRKLEKREKERVTCESKNLNSNTRSGML